MFAMAGITTELGIHGARHHWMFPSGLRVNLLYDRRNDEERQDSWYARN